jgi:hypothetical protein
MHRLWLPNSEVHIIDLFVLYEKPWSFIFEAEKDEIFFMPDVLVSMLHIMGNY